jgi:hypothetical protein
MTRKSGTHFCDKVMLKLLNWRMFLSIRRFRLIGTSYRGARFADVHDCVQRVLGAKRLRRNALPTTKTLESAMAPAAIIGESSVPLTG